MFLQKDQVAEDDLVRMGKSLAHRGPDHFAVTIVDQAGFAHNRLSIIDPTQAGDQPFFNDNYYLIYNGEIYNHQELRKDLLAKGCIFKGTSDTETLFLYLKAYGVPATLDKIRGMFAFAFYDRAKKQLFLCRDRYGIKPLFWTHNARGLFWASEIKALAVEPGVKIDPIRTLFSITGSGDQSNKYTIFQDVFHVPPGHYLMMDESGQPVINEYYSVAHDIDESYYRELSLLSEEAILTLFEQLLSSSVKKMLMSDVPLGIFVSGGIDSSLIAALACRHQPGVMLFTSDVTGKFSELPYSQLLSKSLNAPLHVSKFRPEQTLEDLASVTYHYETPIVKFLNAIPFSRVAELACQNGVKPVLTGEGADELFLGYPGIHYSKYKKILDFPKTLVDRFYGLLPLIKNYVAQSQSENINDFLAKLSAGFERQYMRETGGLEAYHFIPGIESRKAHYQAVQMIREHLIALLHRNDRMGMQYNIESRFPFLDEDVVRFGVNLPLKWKVRTVGKVFDPKHPFSMEKAIVRMTARKILPEKLANKPKWGFGSYGHKYMTVHPEYFKRGYLSDLLHIDDDVLDYIAKTQDQYMIAKLVSLDVFGRIFDRHESQHQVTERIMKYIKMDIV
jgi:asparagine synthase (glutamine-hydrolysing)